MITHPSIELLSHNFSRTDVFVVVYCVVDDWMKQRYGSSNAPRRHRGPGPHEFADSEVLTVLLVGELCHCPRERAWLRQVRSSYGWLFPALPEESRFSRRAQRARELLRVLRRAILFWADADLEPIRLLDSFPMPLCACYRIHQSTQPISGSGFAWNDSKKQFYFGLHPLLVVTATGFIDDLVLAPAHFHDTRTLAAYLDECQEQGRDISSQDWVADKGFCSRPLAAKAAELQGVFILARQKDYQKDQPPSFWQQLLDKVRKPIEGIISVLSGCFGVARMLVRTDIGLYRRTQAKAAAFSLARYFNAVLGTEPMNIARYAV